MCLVFHLKHLSHLLFCFFQKFFYILHVLVCRTMATATIIKHYFRTECVPVRPKSRHAAREPHSTLSSPSREHVVCGAGRTPRSRGAARRTGHYEIPLFNENRAGVKRILVFEIAERSVAGEAEFLSLRLEQLELWSCFRLRSAEAHERCLDSVLFLHLPLHIVSVLCSLFF